MPVGLAMKFEHVPDLGVRELDAQRVARRRVQHRFGRCGARLRPQRFDGRPGPRRLDAIADGLLERGHLGHRRVRLLGSYSEASRYSPSAASSWSLLLEFSRALEMRPGGGHHRALQRDRIVRIVGIGLHGPPVRRDGFVEIAGAHRALALPERLAGGASAGDDRQRQKNPELAQPSASQCPRINLQSAIAAPAIRNRNLNQQSSICNQQFS